MEIPLNKVRIDIIGLETNTEEEELYIELVETLSLILQILSVKIPHLIGQILMKFTNELLNPDINEESTYTSMYHTCLILLEFYLQ